MHTKKEKNHTPMIVLSTIIFYFFNRLSFMFRLTPQINLLRRISLVLNNLSGYFFDLPSFETIDLIVGVGAVGIVLLIVEMRSNGQKKFRKGVEHGSAEWGTKKDIEPFLSKNKRNRLLLSDTESLPLNERPKHPKYERNKNVLLVGGSGSGKTRFFLKPNLLQHNSSYVVTDPKGELLRDTGEMFRQLGYKIKIFNTVDFVRSMGYNFFSYIRSQKEILMVVDFIMENTTNDKKTGGDDFWPKAEKLLFTALLSYMYEVCKEYEFNMETLNRLITSMTVTESDEETDTIVDELFKEHAEEFPDSFCCRQYTKFREHAAGKTAKTILLSLGVRLMPFDIDEVRNATRKDELDIESIGDEKTILYLVVSDTSATFDFLGGLFYTQLFNKLIEHADRQPGGRLKYHVQCFLDEFINIGTIPKFERLIATMRSRGLSAVIVVQAIAQLKAKYKESADTIIGNCDTEIFLGGREENTLKSLSKALGKETIDVQNRNTSYGQHKSWSDNNTQTGRLLLTEDEIAQLDNSKCIVQIRGVKPFLSDKIQLEKHPNYHLLSDSATDGKQFDSLVYINEYRAERRKEKQAEVIRTKALNRDGVKEEYQVKQNPPEESTTFDPIKELQKQNEARSA